MNIKTLTKIQDLIYITENRVLLNALYDYHYGITKRISNDIVAKELETIIDKLKKCKIVPHYYNDYYDFEVEDYFEVYYSKESVRDAYLGVKNSVKILQNMLKNIKV